jgi:hypothetical protein
MADCEVVFSLGKAHSGCGLAHFWSGNIPWWLKPDSFAWLCGVTEAKPFQDIEDIGPFVA